MNTKINWVNHIHYCSIREFSHEQYKAIAVQEGIHYVSDKVYKMFATAFYEDIEENIGVNHIGYKEYK